MNEVWNLEPIYKGFDDPAFARDYEALKALVEKLKTFSGELEGMEPLAGLTRGIALSEELTDLVNKLAEYASLRQSADTRDQEAGSQMGRIMALYSDTAAPLAVFSQWASSLENLEALVAGDENLRDYAYYFENVKSPAGTCSRGWERRLWPGWSSPAAAPGQTFTPTSPAPCRSSTGTRPLTCLRCGTWLTMTMPRCGRMPTRQSWRHTLPSGTLRPLP